MTFISLVSSLSFISYFSDRSDNARHSRMSFARCGSPQAQILKVVPRMR